MGSKLNIGKYTYTLCTYIEEFTQGREKYCIGSPKVK